MAYKVFEDFSANDKSAPDSNSLTLQADGSDQINLPDSSFVRDADLSRDGMDLVLETPNGETITIEEYFAQTQPPALVAPNGMRLTPELIQSFTHGGNEYAAANTQTDVSPIGAVQEISGEAIVTRLNGTTETLGIGTPIYQGDVVETSEDGAVNIVFVDNTTFAVSEDARLAIDEYVFDPATQSGTSNFSVLKGVFVFTSGLIGRDDPDQVEINTPSGSIGIRGTIIAGDVDTGEITVIEGAIVLHDFSGNSVTLSSQFETAKFIPSQNTIEHIGTLSSENVSGKFMSVSTVSADLFSSIQDAAVETGQDNTNTNSETQKAGTTESVETSTEGTQPAQEPQPGESTSLEPAPTTTQTILEEPISSTDIVTAGTTESVMKNSTIQSKPVLQPTAQDTSTIGTVTTTSTTAPISTVTQDSVDPKTLFNVTITKSGFAENTAGSPVVAVIKGHYTETTNLFLNGISNNFFDLNRIDDNTFEVRLKAGVTMDAEGYKLLKFTATNASGLQAVSDAINLSVINADETAFLTNAEPQELFTASASNSWSHNFAIDFKDPEGQIDNYQIVGTEPVPGLNGVTSYNFDTTTGIMTIDFNGSVPAHTYNFTVKAMDGAATLTSKTISFETYAATDTTPGGTSLSGTSQVYSGSGIADTVNISGSNDKALTDGGNDTIIVGGTNNFANAGHGSDNLIMSSGTGNTLVGGAGHDTFTLNVADQNEFYGGEDIDKFTISSASALSDLTSGTGIVIDGGSQYDTLELKSGLGGNLDFSAINNAFVKNMESIHTDNGASNAITLKYSDVLAMTDDGKTLTINMDASDTLTFINDAGANHTMYAVGDPTGGGFQTYSDGTITLLVDTQNAGIAGL